MSAEPVTGATAVGAGILGDWRWRQEGAACLVVLAVLVALVGVGLTVCLVILGLGCLIWWWRRRIRLLAARRQAQLPEGLERLAGALRTGSSLPQALAEAGEAVEPPLGSELADLAVAAHRGRPVAEVVDEWSAARGDTDTRLVATAVVLAGLLGTAPARALDGVAATLRERLQLAAERRALSTQARTSAIVLSIAPVALSLLLAAADPAIAHFLFLTPAGWCCIALGAGLDALGALWMSRLTQAVVA